MLLGELLVAEGLATETEIGTALALQERYGGRIGEHLIDIGAITRATLDAALRKQYEMARAIVIAEDRLDKALRRYGAGDPQVERLRYRVAAAFAGAGQFAEALPLAQTALDSHARTLGPAHPWTRDAAQLVADASERLAAIAAPAGVPAPARGRRRYQASAQPSRRGSEPASSIPSASRRMISTLHGPSRAPTVLTG